MKIKSGKARARRLAWLSSYKHRRPKPNDSDFRSGYSYFKRCPDCGGNMYWCTSCEIWSKTCCEDYGSCLCS